MENIRSLFGAFSKIQGFDGWMIGKLFFYKQKNNRIMPEAAILWQKKNFALLEVTDGENCIQMTVIKPDKIPKAEDKRKEFFIPQEWRLVASKEFFKEEILTFTKETGDANWIHQTKEPVVPGLLMAEWLWNIETISLQNKAMVFRTPAYAGEKVMLYMETDAKKYYGVVRRQNTHLLWELQE